jgi:hypothetical protein
MKVLIVIISIAAMAMGISAQTARSSAEPAGLKIVRVELQRIKAKGPTMRAVPSTDPTSQSQAKADRMRDVDNNPALHRLSKDAEIAPVSGSAPMGSSGTGTPTTFVASILVENIGIKTVTAVYWEYLLFESGGKEPVKRYAVHSKRTVPPGEQAELTKEVTPKGQEHQARIFRIEYADGSFWGQPK